MTDLRDEFFSKSRDLAQGIASHRRALTFVLGAGASLSSAAPSTPVIHARLAAVTRGRFKGHVREHLHELPRQEVRDQLQPLFAHVVPDVGYRLLAAMGRTRRIYVIALNWDDAVRQACVATGTPVAHFDPLREGNLDDEMATLPCGRGVLVVHVHGSLDDDARYGFLDTAPNRPKIWQTVVPLLAHDTIICGASLTGDLDVADVMEKLRDSDRDHAAAWLFSRPGGDPPLVPVPQSWQQVESEQVDFDDLMIILAEEALGATGQSLTRWNELVDALSYLDLPEEHMLVEIAPAVRRHALAARVAGLVAPPFSGKSVGVVRLAHLRRLIDGVEEPLRVSVDLQDSPAELAISVSRGDVVAVVDDPFGSNAPQTNPRVRDFLMALCEADGGYACVSSPIANWEAEAGPLLRTPKGLYLAPQQPADWYERERLARLAERLHYRRPALRQINARQLQTPPEVLEAGRTGHAVDRERLVADKVRMLEKNSSLGLLCAMVRLQERRSAPIPPAELTAILGCELDEVAGIEAMLSAQHLDGATFWVFNHSTSAAAADSYLTDHFDEVRQRLTEAVVFPAWVERCLAGWALASGLPDSLADELDPEEELEPADWMAQRLGSRPDEEQLAAMELVPRDTWGTIEYAYEVVRVWDSISDLPSGRRILDDLVQRPMGVYALLEGCLYFDLGAADELWVLVMNRLYELTDDPARDFERLLILDAVMWRVPSYRQLLDWAGETIAKLDPHSPDFALVRFAAGYHPAGMATLKVESALRADSERSWTPEQATVAARLVAWHFAHQSRSRVLLHRRSDLDKAWLCQALGQAAGEEGVDQEAQMRLVRSLASHPHTVGWAFHLACNLAVVSTLDLREESARAVVQGALENCPLGDPGVLSAMVAYSSAGLFARTLRVRIDDPGEFDGLMVAMGEGIEVADGLRVDPPRFRYIHDPEGVHRAFGLDWPDLDSDLPRTPEPLAAGLWHAAARLLEGQKRGVRRHIAAMVERVERGDFRPVLSSARVPRSGDAFEDAVLRMLSEQDPSAQDESLF